jgi:hypothetical protein
MICLETITIKTQKGKREICLTPVMLTPEDFANIQSVTFKKLHLYDDLRDETYKKNNSIRYLDKMPNSEDLVVNYGQDFSNYYLGELDIDLDTKQYSNWKAKSDKFSVEDLKLLMEQLFSIDFKPGRVIIFTPTNPADINLGLRKATH